MELDGSSGEGVLGWIPYHFAKNHQHNLVEGAPKSWESDASRAHSVEKMYGAKPVTWVVPAVDLCSLASAITFINRLLQLNLKI